MRKKRLTAVLMALMFLLVTVASPIEVQAAKKVKVSKVTVAAPYSKSAVIAKGKKIQLSASVKVTPNKKSNKGVTYKSSNKKVATVTSKGVVKAVKAGTAKITVQSKKNKKKKAVVKIKVVKNSVSKIKLNKKKATVNVGSTLKLKAKVTAKKGAGKAVRWSSSKSKIATVSAKGVVTPKKAGTTVITAKAADGSGKKASCKVTVTNKGELAAFNILNAQTVTFSLNVPIALTADKVILQKKALAEGSYNQSLQITSLTTTDQKNYTAVISTDNRIYEREYVKITIPSLKGKVKSLEKQYLEPVTAYTGDYLYRFKVGEKKSVEFSAPGEGYHAYTVNGLPAGLSSKVDDGYLVIEGVPTTAGVTNATVTYKDEVGNTGSANLIFLVGSNDAVVAGALPQYILTNGEDTSASVGIEAIGGTGGYTYQIVAANPSNLSASINEYGSNLYVRNITQPGTYSVTVRVTDSQGRSSDATAVFNVKAGYKFVGKVVDAQGNPVSQADVIVANKDKSDRYGESILYKNDAGKFNAYSNTNKDGEYELFAAPGTFDFAAYHEYSDTKNYAYKVSLGNGGTAPTISLPVYKVSINGLGEDANAKPSWFDQNNRNVGYGTDLFLKPGTYQLKTDEDFTNTTSLDWKTVIKEAYEYQASFNLSAGAISVNASRIVTDSYTTSYISNIVLELGKNYVGDEEEDYFKFIPDTTDKYVIEDDYDDSLIVYDENHEIVDLSNGAYQLKARTTYYVYNQYSDYINISVKESETTEEATTETPETTEESTAETPETTDVK